MGRRQGQMKRTRVNFSYVATDSSMLMKKFSFVFSLHVYFYIFLEILCVSNVYIYNNKYVCVYLAVSRMPFLRK